MYIGVQWCESWDILAPNPVIQWPISLILASPVKLDSHAMVSEHLSEDLWYLQMV